MTDLLDCVEHQTGDDPRWAVLWLHGLGADGHDFAPIVPDLVRREWPALRFVFPPYQVGPYSDGVQTVEVPAAVLRPYLADDVRGLFSP